MQPDASKIRQLLKKTQHFDKDERFMATSDLTTELEKVDGQLDSSLQTPIRDAIVHQLEDPSNDVQAIACRCLSAIVQKFNSEQVEEIVDKLGDLLISGKMELRDIYTIALKNIISSVPDNFGPQISKKLAKRLVQGFKMSEQKGGDTEEETREHARNHFNRLVACLDILKDLTVRFGFVMSDHHEDIVTVVQPMLNSPQADIRKKVAVSLGAVVAVVNDSLFQRMTSNVIDQIKQLKSNDDKIFTYIQTIGIFSRNGGKRISAYLKDVVPLLISICTDESMDDSATDSTVELRENCLQAFETLILQCPTEVSDYTEKLLETGLKLMRYDPMYSYDEEMTDGGDDTKMEEDADGFGGDDDDWGDDDGDDGWGADAADDVVVAGGDDEGTWKVRRAALKMLAAFIQTHKVKVLEYQFRLCDELLAQFREHDVTVKLELFNTFRELLLATIVADQGGINSQALNALDLPPLVRQRSDFHIIAQKLPDIMAVITAQIKSGNAQVRAGLLSIIRHLVIIRQAERSQRCDLLGDEGLKEFFPTFIPQLVACIQDNEVQLKTSALYVLYLILNRHQPKDGLLIVNDVKAVVIEALKGDYARAKAQALLSVTRIAQCIRPLTPDNSYDESYNDTVKEIFAVVSDQLLLKDVEQEVKKSALEAVAALIAHFGDLLSTECNDVLQTLLKRLGNEVTRQTALVSFATIADSPLQIDISKICNKLVEEMSSFLKKHSQTLKLDTATTLKSIARSCGKSIEAGRLNALITQCAEFVNDSDLHLCHLILDLVSEVMIVQKDSCVQVSKVVLPVCFQLLQSPLLQGHALESLKRLFEVFQKTTGGALIKFESLKNELIKAAAPKLSRQSYAAIAQCLSTLIKQVDEKTSTQSVSELIGLIESKNDHHSQVALLTIGALGAALDLSAHKNIEKKIFSGFNRESESVKWAASYALGNISVGNMTKYVPILLQMIKDNPNRQYLLLNSLKEIISVHSNTDGRDAILPFSSSIVPLLLENASSEDEGVRAMIAECLGRFAIIDADICFEIEKLLTVKQFTTRATMATSLKFAVNKTNNFIPQSTVQTFLKLLDDSDLTVKRQAFLTVNTILHVHSRLITADFGYILPIIYRETATNDKLIREVDLGPFKHRVDDGLPLRKAAYQCLDTLLDSAPTHLDLHEFIKFLQNGLTDESPDIQMLTYQILHRLGHFHGTAIVAALDELPDPLMKGIKAKLNEAKGTKDAERAKDILRAAVKALYALNNIQNVDKARKFSGFYERVKKTSILKPMIAELQKESKHR